MKLYVFFGLLVNEWCLCAAATVYCGMDPSPFPHDPCTCDAAIIVIQFNGRSPVGTAIVIFNSSFDLTMDSCNHNHVNMSDNVITLQAGLQEDPCIHNIVCILRCSGSNPKTLSFEAKFSFDNAPEFPRNSYNTTVFENEDVGTTVFNFTKNKPVIVDTCIYPSFIYAIEDGNEEGKFQSVQGNIILNQTLDYDKGPKEYVLTIRAVDNGREDLPGYTQLVITVKDADDNSPAFTHLEYYLTIPEETIPAENIPSEPPVRGYDRDMGINQTIQYSFEDWSNTDKFLEISNTDGTFGLKYTVDRENISSYTAILWCYQSDDNWKTATARLYVTVSDVNDNPAVFSPVDYNVTLVENAIGYVTTVTATDADLGDNAVILYELVNGTELFQIDEHSGVIVVKTPEDLDRETYPNFTILVTAKDNDGNYSMNTATVIVTLQDVNDNSPVFSKERYVFHINSTTDGSFVGQVTADDDDGAATGNGNVTYSLHKSSVNQPFHVDKLSGMVTTVGQINTTQEYRFLVEACDNPPADTNRRCTLVEVIAVYGQMNFTFHSEDIEVKVLENTPMGTVFGDQLPLQGDKYHCFPDSFEVDVLSRMLMSKILLDREENDTHHLTVDVFQYDELIGNVSVTVRVLDVNDNQPVFSEVQYFFTLPDSPTDVIGSAQASDADGPVNANLTFTFQSNSNLFSINSTTGIIYIKDASKYRGTSKQSLFNLVVMVNDQGIPPLTSLVPIYISAMKIGPTLGIPMPHIRQGVVDSEVKSRLEKNLSEILGFETVEIIDVDYISSQVQIKASNNGTEVPLTEVQMAVISNWSPIQDLFRELMVAAELTSGTGGSMTTPEIALIAIAVAILFGGVIAVVVICKQWDTHIKHQRLYDNLKRPSVLYDSQELRVDFGDEEMTSRHSTFHGPRNKDKDPPLEGSFGPGYINTGYEADDENAPKTPTWSVRDTPRIPHWSTTDSLKDAMQSLEELTSRLNSEDNLSRVSNMSKGKQSDKSNRSEPVTPRSVADPDAGFVPSGPGYEPLARNSQRNYSKLRPEENGSSSREADYENHKPDEEVIRDVTPENGHDGDYEPVDSPRSLVKGETVFEESTAF